MSKRIITGITPSGYAHLGNYIGAIAPAVARQSSEEETFIFIADHHSLVKLWDADLRRDYILDLAATWLALGVDPDQTVFYRQSDVPEILELNWILTTVTSKGLLNRAHAYKALVAENENVENTDPDAGITMGLFTYPMLMTADILAFNAHAVPVGKDQVQHIEIARDIAARFNHVYGDTFVLPEAIVDPQTHTMPGLDGRKMSKSYDNTIALFEPEKRLRKRIMKIVTNSQAPEEPKSTEGCTLFMLYKAFADEQAQQLLAERYAEGIGWGDAKQVVFEAVNNTLSAPRDVYNDYKAHPEKITSILEQGAEKARKVASPLLKEVKEKVGIL